MNERVIFDGIIIAWLILAAAVFILLFFVTAPYGRYSRKGWGPTIDNKLGWMVMESASALLFALFFILGDHRNSSTAVIFLFMWEAHYVHRAFIYPLSLHGPTKRIPIFIVAFGLFFNCINAYLNGHYLFSLSGGYDNAWLSDPRFIIGLMLFLAGFMVNRHSDRVLGGLRKKGENSYEIPYGGFYRWVSSPNYLGELAIWSGWALATWSLPGLTFAIWTAANLVPRARANHLWYKSKFTDYPEKRRILIPGIW
jgi:protein-S-isoprenylcysteine O-methyltransferase Ste14